MNDNLRQAWEELERVESVAASLRARVVDGVSVSGRTAFVAIDGLGDRHLLVPTESDAAVGVDARSAGIRISSRELVDGPRTEQFVDVHCRKPHLNALFDVVALEMIDAAAAAPLALVASACRGVLERWRELIERASGMRIDLHALIGAWGELWFVREALRQGVPFDGLWIGPLGEVHDLRGPSGVELEVKATLARGPLLVEIHGLDQLEPPADRPLYLGVLRLARAPSGETLIDLADAARDMGASPADLGRLLAAVGLTTSAPEAMDNRFSVSEARLYQVTLEFPRIVRSSFRDGRLPPGTASITYTLDLTGEPPTPIPASDFAATMHSLGKV